MLGNILWKCKMQKNPPGCDKELDTKNIKA